jgi:hypothetical protein
VTSVGGNHMVVSSDSSLHADRDSFL